MLVHQGNDKRPTALAITFGAPILGDTGTVRSDGQIAREAHWHVSRNW